MRRLLWATIVLLVIVTLGLAVYSYTEHREVAYLTLRVDHLEKRMTEMESAPSAVSRIGEEVEHGAEVPTSQSTSSPGMSLEVHDDIASTAPTSLKEINRIRQVRYGLEPLTLEEANNLRREGGIPPLPSESIQEEGEEIGLPSLDSESAMRAQTAYSDQELYESRAEGPDRPECEVVRQRAARNVPTWMELNFISAFGCLTPVEERIRKLENQSLYPPRNGPQRGR